MRSNRIARTNAISAKNPLRERRIRYIISTKRQKEAYFMKNTEKKPKSDENPLKKDETVAISYMSFPADERSWAGWPSAEAEEEAK